MWILTLLISFCFAHDLQHSLSKEGKCVVLSFYFPDGTKFSYEKYEVYREGERLPFQVGRTDALGRVVFCPDKKGSWTVKTTSEDGHGALVEVKVENTSLEAKGSFFERYQKVFVGGGIILGLFGLLELYIRRISWLRRFF
jgi:nickel transport protein